MRLLLQREYFCQLYLNYVRQLRTELIIYLQAVCTFERTYLETQ